MKLAALVIDDSVEAQVKNVKAHALIHRHHLTEIVQRMNGSRGSIGDDENFVVRIPPAWKVVYSIEQQPEPTGWVHHFSFTGKTLDGQSAYFPKQIVEQIILPLFGMAGERPCYFYEEDLGKGIMPAVNLLFPYKGELP